MNNNEFSGAKQKHSMLLNSFLANLLANAYSVTWRVLVPVPSHKDIRLCIVHMVGVPNFMSVTSGRPKGNYECRLVGIVEPAAILSGSALEIHHRIVSIETQPSSFAI